MNNYLEEDDESDFVALCDSITVITKDNIYVVVREFYSLDGNGAGGSLHIVLDDNNYERDYVRSCLGYAQEKGDLAGIRMAQLLLTLSDEQLHDWFGPGHCSECKVEYGDAHKMTFATPGNRCSECGALPSYGDCSE